MKVFGFLDPMATFCTFPKSDNFSAVPVSSPSNRAINEVSRSNGRAGRAFVRIAPYILEDCTGTNYYVKMFFSF